MRATTPLPADTLLLDRLSGSEGMSRPFELVLDFMSLDGAVDGSKLLRKPIGITVDLPGGKKKRFFHGLVRRFVQLGRDADKLVTYRAEVVPWLWFLKASSHCRVYQNKTTLDIVKSVFSDLGMADYRLSCSGSYTPREYCVQYRESDFDFVSRLMEEEGIYYYFDHTASKHTLVIADTPSGLATAPAGKLSAASSETGTFGDQYIEQLEIESQFFSGKVQLGDYNMETPSLSLQQQTATTVGGVDNQPFGLYDYPGKYATRSEGDRLARLRMEECEALNFAVRGRAKSGGLTSGGKLDIADYYRRDINKTYQLVSIEHDATNGGYRANEGSAEFHSTFLGILATVPFRPARRTPKAVVRGVQTAVVVGPAGEEIFVDKYGRVKVQFFWDQLGQKNDKSSCWVRVATTWAGKAWGAIQIPRIGQEVIVDFLEGDPDRPIITGRVYNADQMPPYDLPANHTQSGMKSRSSPGGGAANFNEIRFEDKKGSEQLFIHAEKNQDIEVENDETHWVGHDRTKTIDNDETTHVKGKRTETVDKDETITITGARTESVTKDETISITGARTESVGKDETVSIKGQRTLSITKDYTTKVTGAVDTKVDGSGVTLKVSTGTIKYDALGGIELKVGGSSIKIDQSGVTIKGIKISIEGQAMTEVKAPMTTVKADAVMTVKGAITMIN